jgi:uncharacterized membrane protein
VQTNKKSTYAATADRAVSPKSHAKCTMKCSCWCMFIALVVVPHVVSISQRLSEISCDVSYSSARFCVAYLLISLQQGLTRRRVFCKNLLSCVDGSAAYSIVKCNGGSGKFPYGCTLPPYLQN